MSYKIVLAWREHLKKVEELQQTALKLMAHPDTTPEQLWYAHQALVSTMKNHRELAPKVQEKWPRLSGKMPSI